MTADPTPKPPIQLTRERLLEVLNQLEVDAYNVGYDRGFDAGWDAAVRRMSAAFEAQEKDEPPAPPPLKSDYPSAADVTAKGVVLNIIRQFPGLRGIEIVEAANKSGVPLNERTVRTALHRLKTAEIIRNDDGKWYPEDMHPTLGVTE